MHSRQLALYDAYKCSMEHQSLKSLPNENEFYFRGRYNINFSSANIPISAEIETPNKNRPREKNNRMMNCIFEQKC